MQNRRKPVRDQNGDRIAARSHIANRLADLFLGQRIERRSSLVKHQQLRPPQQRPRNRKPLLLAARDLHAASPITVSSPLSARASRLSTEACRSTSRHSASVASGPHEQQILADRSRRTVAHPASRIRFFSRRASMSISSSRSSVVVNVPRLRPVESHQQLHQRSLPRRPTAPQTRSSPRAYTETQSSPAPAD